MTAKLEVGQTLYQPPSSIRRNGRTMTVTKIGRKWATLDQFERCTIDTLRLDRGNYSPQQLYPSKADYDRSMVLLAAWSKLRCDMDRSAKPGVTLEAINQVRVLLLLDEAAP